MPSTPPLTSTFSPGDTWKSKKKQWKWEHYHDPEVWLQLFWAHLSHLQLPAPVWTASTSAQTLQDPGQALGCRWSQCHSSLVICNQATKFQVSSGWKGKSQSARWTAQQWRCKPTCWVYGTSWCFGNASAAVGTLAWRDVNRLFIHPENLLHIYTCTSLPVKQHQVNYMHSEAFKPCDLTGRGKLKAGHLLIMKAFTEARLFYLFTVWYWIEDSVSMCIRQLWKMYLRYLC